MGRLQYTGMECLSTPAQSTRVARKDFIHACQYSFNYTIFPVVLPEAASIKLEVRFG